MLTLNPESQFLLDSNGKEFEIPVMEHTDREFRITIIYLEPNEPLNLRNCFGKKKISRFMAWLQEGDINKSCIQKIAKHQAG